MYSALGSHTNLRRTGEIADVILFDAAGKWVFAGLVDMHVHLRVPGGEDSETIETGSAVRVLGPLGSGYKLNNGGWLLVGGGYLKCCTDGPVFPADSINWERWEGIQT